MRNLLVAAAAAFLLATPSAQAGPQTRHGPFSEVSRRVLAAGGCRAIVRLLDGRAHFASLHAGHPGHAGIPTHRVAISFQACRRGKPHEAVLEVSPPSGSAIRTSLWRDGGRLVADLELSATGSHSFRLALSKRVLRWSETLP